MAEWTFDSSAILACLRQEPGGDIVESVFASGIVSSVNLAEVVSRLIDLGLVPEEAMGRALAGGYGVAPFDETLALRAGALRVVTRHLGLSLGDRACLALAGREGLPVLTADRAWAALDIGVQIRLIR